MTATTEKTTDLLVAVLADLAPMVGEITAGQLHDPTPCTELDVGQLRTHVLGWLTTFAAGFADPGGQAPLDHLDGYAVPANPVAEVRSASATMAAALRDGAARPAHAARGQRDARRDGAEHDPLGVPGPRLGSGAAQPASPGRRRPKRRRSHWSSRPAC